nr:hypothetical protein [Tanacetum cinerariifolium]
MTGIIISIHKVSRLGACVADFEVAIFFHLCIASCFADCFLLPSFFKRSRLISKASSFRTMSISAVLKVGMPVYAGKLLSFRTFVSIRLAPKPYMQDDPSVNNVHGSESFSSPSVVMTRESSSGRSTIKFAKICPFIDVLGLYRAANEVDWHLLHFPFGQYSAYGFLCSRK